MKPRRKPIDAESELELRAAEASLRDEVLGDQPLLSLIRDALDRYVAACAATFARPESEWPPNRVVGCRVLAAGYELRGWYITAQDQRPVGTYPSRSCRTQRDAIFDSARLAIPQARWLDVGNGALLLHAEVHATPERARRLLATIEKAIQEVSA